MVHEMMIYLIRRNITGSDINANPVYEEIKKPVFAEEVGTKRNEFYQGLAAGLKPEKTFRIYEFDYADERIVEIQTADGPKRYNISRTYPTGDERLEIICTDIGED